MLEKNAFWTFLSTPSGWRATGKEGRDLYRYRISIHALRVEGDAQVIVVEAPRVISIHALRVEGDRVPEEIRKALEISIHALRVEGDATIPFFNVAP